VLRARHLDDALEGAYRPQPRGTVVRPMTNPVLRGVHPRDDFPVSRHQFDYRPRRTTGSAQTPRQDLREIFVALKEAWLEDTLDASSTSDIVRHPAHLRIIGLGPAALPLILEELVRGSGHWLWALSAIARRDVAQDAETIEEARRAWCEWGRAEGLI